MGSFFILTLIAVPLFAFGQLENSVLINEIAWMGTPVAGVEEKQWWRYEWIELYNAGDTVGTLDGWMLELYRDTLDFRIPLRGAISPTGYFLIGASDKIQGLDLNYKNLAGKFNNSGQKVVLKNALGEVIDEINARDRWPGGDNKTKQTMERCEVCDIGFQTSENPEGTPRAQNSKGEEPKLSVAKEPKLQEKSPPLLLKESDPTGTKKDISISSNEESQNILNSPILVALALALGSSAAILILKKRSFQA